LQRKFSSTRYSLLVRLSTESFLVLVVLLYCLRALHLLAWCSVTWATLLTLFNWLFLIEGFTLCPSLPGQWAPYLCFPMWLRL
jgi:hypothetical protein